MLKMMTIALAGLLVASPLRAQRSRYGAFNPAGVRRLFARVTLTRK
ncbi:MAG TPA: hypothetical protein VFY79_12520 [Dehalococcoidia bacterium]|nr:hypothetical protein [Dehalococcoidia bacterium]